MFNSSAKLYLYCLCLLVVGSCSAGWKVAERSSKGQFDLSPDIELVCDEIRSRYFYFDERAGHWDQSCDRARAEAVTLTSERGSLNVLERLLDDLYDPHVSLDTNNRHSPRLTSDLWFELHGDDYIITAVRPLCGAANAGVKIGDQLVSFNGLRPAELAYTRIHSGLDDISPQRQTWAINAAIAGRRDESRNIQIIREKKTLTFELSDPEPALPDEPVTHKVLLFDVGYIRFNDSLGETHTVEAFHSALNAMRDTRGMILDLRSTPSGGDTGIAEPIMGRFFAGDSGYQITIPKNEEAYTSIAGATGPWTYDKPLIVLVGRWTGSMGEGIAIGFDGIGRAAVIGSRMAGLAGGIEDIPLKKIDDVAVHLPTYDLRHLDGTPRHLWAPSEIAIADNGNEPDRLLDTAIRMLTER